MSTLPVSADQLREDARWRFATLMAPHIECGDARLSDAQLVEAVLYRYRRAKMFPPVLDHDTRPS